MSVEKTLKGKLLAFLYGNSTAENGTELSTVVQNSDFPSGKSPRTVDIIQL